MSESARRTFLLLPGHEPRKTAKAATLAIDAVIFDMEDGVPPTHKQAARDGIRAALAAVDYGPRERMVRINGIDTDLWREDLDALDCLPVDGLYIPKVEDRTQITELRRYLDGKDGPLARAALFATVETALGLTRVEDIAAAGGMAGLFFGSGDYSLSTGIEISRESLLYPRSRIAVAAAANGLQAVDVAYFMDVKDGPLARQDGLDARALGFTGKVVFHPNQIDPVNAVFTPGPDEIAHAEKILVAFEAAQGSGRGVFMVDGDFVAVDIALMAEKVLRRAGRLAKPITKGNDDD
tara:strand:- start:1245 stop:2129 length:885 start_codon:yes stop_codon:yes gene_type:complete